MYPPDPWWLGFFCALNLMIMVHHFRGLYRRRFQFKKGERVRVNAIGRDKGKLELLPIHGNEYTVEDPLDGWVQLQVEDFKVEDICVIRRTFLVRADCLVRVKPKKATPPEPQPVPDTPSP